MNQDLKETLIGFSAIIALGVACLITLIIFA